MLTQDEATARVARVGDVSYDLAFDLRAGDSLYGGDCTIAFSLDGTTEPLFLDFRGGSISSLSVNGRAVDVERDAERIDLVPSLLESRMTVRIRYENEFDTTGDGFHRFIDPEDGLEYAYSNFQPFSAHRLFPCFDQPDIKATYGLVVDAPADWLVVSAEREVGSEPLADGRLRHRFARTPAFSTYLLALVVGPFHVIRTTRPDGIELGLMCRRSMARYLEPDAAEILEVTGQGFDFFAGLFGTPYPFAKYDQLFVPEFNVGAMENVGAVTFTENFIFRDPPTDSQRQTRAEVVLHELAHMWFGNLVTMRWWNDLWLNESFASYVSYLALTEATRFRGAWKAFATQLKRWAYRQDQLVTTHPISGEAPDTDSAFLNFDGITYGKGASVLKQLVATIGRDGFAEGMRTYFRRHAWGNATLADFLSALESGSGRELGSWAHLWLETASLNTIAARWDAADGRIERLELHQTAPPDHPTLRPHSLQVGLVTEAQGRLGVEAIPASVSTQRTDVPQAKGRPRPVLVFPNHDDHAYAKVQLDPVSLDFVRRRVTSIEDPLLRELLWMSLWEMVRDGTLPSTEYLAIVRARIPAEPDAELLAAVLERTQATLRWYVPERMRERESTSIVRLALEALPRAAGADPRIIWRRAAIAAAASAFDLAPLLAMADDLADQDENAGFDQRMRWDLAVKAVAHSVSGAQDRVDAESVRDPSDRGQRAVIRAAAARPDPTSKAEAWRRIQAEGFGSFHLTRAAMEGFLWPSQAPILAQYGERFFDEVRGIFETRDRSFATAYAELLFPSHVPDPSLVTRARALLEELRTDETLLRRVLHETVDDLERALRVRAVAEATG
ncbi:MAG: aminopeptidase N [Chloroflexi bacterium]|nr:aminopeptidase N [Chloroflexota bacterium]